MEGPHDCSLEDGSQESKPMKAESHWILRDCYVTKGLNPPDSHNLLTLQASASGVGEGDSVLHLGVRILKIHQVQKVLCVVTTPTVSSCVDRLQSLTHGQILPPRG